jgi:hypothetical protein
MDKMKHTNAKEEENKWCGEATCIFFAPFFTASLCGFLPFFLNTAKLCLWWNDKQKATIMGLFVYLS